MEKKKRHLIKPNCSVKLFLDYQSTETS